MKSKGFTLIELLVVVAIIGILAAVGVNTFTGFQEKAKISTVKSINKNVEKYIRAELLKCDLGEATIFNNGEYGPLSCTGKYGASGPKAATFCYIAENTFFISFHYISFFLFFLSSGPPLGPRKDQEIHKHSCTNTTSNESTKREHHLKA